MASQLHKVRTSVASRWRTKLVGGNKNQTQHWKTKERYYDVAEQCLKALEPPRNAKELRSKITDQDGLGTGTFYTVIGENSRHPLLRAYVEEACPELAEIYRRNRDAPIQLVDEARVDRYWSRREGWLQELEAYDEPTAEMATSSLIRLVQDWSMQSKALAGWLDHLPPICAVEDLMILRPALKAGEACDILEKVVRRTLGPDRMDAHEVLQAARADLLEVLPETPPTAEELVQLISEAAAQLAETPPVRNLQEELKAVIVCLEDILARTTQDPDGDDDA